MGGKSMSESDNYEEVVKDAASQVAEFDHHNRPSFKNFSMPCMSIRHWCRLLCWSVIIIFGFALGSKFFSPFALTLILQQVQIVGIVAAAQSLVILTAGIDLSVGAIAVFSSVVMGQFTFDMACRSRSRLPAVCCLARSSVH